MKYAIYGILLYLLSTILLIQLMLPLPDSEIWNVLFWLILLFTCVQAVAKSFMQESRQRFVYYYTLSSAKNIIIAKIIYNMLIMLLLSVASYFIFLLLLGNPGVLFFKFLVLVLVGGISLSLLFTFLSAISAKAGGNSALIAVLGFPLVLPQLFILRDLSLPLFQDMVTIGWWKLFFVLLALDVLIFILSYFLFPFIWRD